MCSVCRGSQSKVTAKDLKATFATRFTTYYLDDFFFHPNIQLYTTSVHHFVPISWQRSMNKIYSVFPEPFIHTSHLSPVNGVAQLSKRHFSLPSHNPDEDLRVL